MIGGLFPEGDHISWEAHLVGLLGGGGWGSATLKRRCDGRVPAQLSFFSHSEMLLGGISRENTPLSGEAETPAGAVLWT